MRSLRLAVAFLVLLTAPAGAGVYNPTSFTLDNGLQVVVVENHRAPIVMQMVWYKVGAADEPPGFSGVAHFLEHLMFKGTPSIPPGAFSKIIARNGGQDNAFTTYDYTAYFQRVARDKLELVMRMEADRMRNLRLTDAVVLPERDVVLEERRMRTDNRPEARLQEQARAMLFLNHPYGDPVIGWEHEIAALDRKAAMDFYKRYYAPNNAVVIVAGDVTPDAVRRLAETYYGPLEPQPIPPRIRPAEPPHAAPARVTLVSPRVRQPQWDRSYVAPSLHTDKAKAYALEVLAEILGGGTTSRLYRALVVEKKLAAGAGAWYGARQLDRSVFALSATPRQGVAVADVEAAVDREIARVIEHGVTETELAGAKRRLTASAVFARDSLSAAPNDIGRALTTGLTIADVEAWPDRIEAVTAEAVREAAKDVLQGTDSVTSILLPKSTS